MGQFDKPCPICGRTDKTPCRPGSEADECGRNAAFDQFGETPTQHWSDCAVHNEPAMPAGPCNCGGIPMISGDVLHADLVELLTILGMGDHARPQSPHEVFQEALGALRKKLAPMPFPGRRGEKAIALAEAAANRWDAFNDRAGVYWLSDAILGFKTEDDQRTIAWANNAVEQLQEALTDAERERDEWRALYQGTGPNSPHELCNCNIGDCVKLTSKCREMSP